MLGRRGVTAVLEARFPVDVVRGVPVVTVPEEVDVTNAAALRQALVAAAADGFPALVIDMTRTRFCDSAALRVLVCAHKQARAEGGEVLLAVPGAAVLRVLAITGIDQVIPNYSSLDEALAHAAEPADEPR
jgi:anti-sigma B factor antagonist